MSDIRPTTSQERELSPLGRELLPRVFEMDGAVNFLAAVFAAMPAEVASSLPTQAVRESVHMTRIPESPAEVAETPTMVEVAQRAVSQSFDDAEGIAA
jgi:hypothetical protein